MSVENNVNFSKNLFETSVTNKSNKTPITEEKANFTQVSSLIKADSLTINNKTGSVTPTISLHTSSVNQKIMDNFMKYDNNNQYKPIIEKVSSDIKNGTSRENIEKNAINFTKKTYPNLSNEEILSKAYRSIVVGLIKNPEYSDPKFFNGQKDKLLHFFTSASLTVDLSKKIPLLPNSAKTFIGASMIGSIGVMKEIKDITGTGFDKEDIKANLKGISSARENMSKLEKNQFV
ncbi:MAG: hypothetical protein U0457_04710 [Candidatus Sericytochromatia bacterium]